jgi:DNA-directed RNA polymerase II subunit RPB2
VVMNQSSVDRGLFSAFTYKTISEEERKQSVHLYDKFGLPPLNKRRRDANYSLLDENGIIRRRLSSGENVRVEIGDVIIGRVSIQSTKAGDEEITDTSVVIKKDEEGYIDRIFTSVSPDGYTLIKIVIRKERIPELGDKFSSRIAQKGTVGLLLNQEDMPFTASGIVPDLLINSHCLKFFGAK